MRNGLRIFRVPRDHFELDDGIAGILAFPCNVCKYQYGSDTDEPCIRCDWNCCSKSDEELEKS